MAKLKEYNRSVTIPGLPDTTNISDPQLRLFLDRVKLFCSELAVTVNGLERYKDIDNIAADLIKSEYFNNTIKQTITQTVSPIVDNKIIDVDRKRKNKDIPLEALGVTPESLVLNVYISETGYVQEDYTPYNTSSKYKGVVWSSSDDTVATVDQNGIVTAVAVGECFVTAASTFNSSITASAAVEVINAETITVTAPYRWCTSAESSSVYTESQEPGAGGFAWAATENTVTLYPDKTENESKALVAVTSVSSIDNRDYIIADSKKYWRDEEKTQEVSGAEYVGTVFYWPPWDELEWGFPGSFVPVSIESVRDYKCVKVRFTPDDGDYPGTVFSGTILTDTFPSADIPADATPEDALELFLELNTTSALLLSGKYVDEDGDVIASSDAADNGDEHGTWGLLQRGTGVAFYAWTQSPCAGDETVYTVSENPAIGDDYGSVVDGTFTKAGTVSDTGSGVYSFTGANNNTYFRHE